MECISNNENNNNTNECNFTYSIEITFNNETNFILLLPLPQISNESISSVIISKLEIKEGFANWSINISDKGKAIKLEGTGGVKLYSSGNSDIYAYDHLSMQNNNKREYWVYLNSSDNSTGTIEINADCHCNKNSETTITKISGEVKNGWNIVNGIHSHSLD